MKNNKPLVFIAVILMISIVNYSKLKGIENIRTIEFLSIFSIGILSGLLIREIIAKFKNK